MGIIGDISDTLFRFYDLWKPSSRANRLAHFFEQDVLPSYNSLKAVHLDYLDMFAELQSRLAAKNGLSQATINWLARTRAKHQFMRSEIRSIRFRQSLAQCTTVEDFVELKREFTRYKKAIADYFHPPGDSRCLILDMAGAPVVKRIERGSPSLAIETALSEIIKLTRTEEELAMAIVSRTLRAAEVQPHDLLDGLDAVRESLEVITERNGKIAQLAREKAPMLRLYYEERDVETARVPGINAAAENPASLRNEIDRKVAMLKRRLTESDEAKLQEHLFSRSQVSRLSDLRGWKPILIKYVANQSRHLQVTIAQVQRAYMRIKLLCLP